MSTPPATPHPGWSELSGRPVRGRHAGPMPATEHTTGPLAPSARRRPLEGVRVLVPVTDTHHPLCEAVELRGGVAVPLALTRLQKAPEPVIGHALAMLAASAWAVFLTPRAVDVLAEDGRPVTPLIEVARMTSGLHVAAADRAIAASLEALNVRVDRTPVKGAGTLPIVLSLPRGPLLAAGAAPVAGYLGAAAEASASAPQAPPMPELPSQLTQTLGAIPSGLEALLGPSTPRVAARRDPADVPTRERRVVLLGSDVIDPRAVEVVRALGWECEPIRLHVSEAAALTAAEVSTAMAHGTDGRPRWPSVALFAGPESVQALTRAAGTPPTAVGVACADEQTARAALDLGLRVDVIAANTSTEGLATAAAAAWERAWKGGYVS